jgi:hypothetical protein
MSPPERIWICSERRLPFSRRWMLETEAPLASSAWRRASRVACSRA